MISLGKKNRQVAHHGIHRVVLVRSGKQPLGERHRLSKRCLGLGRGNHLELFHPRENLVPLRESGAGILEGI